MLEWSEDLEIGIGVIDDQHKKLIQRINSFSAALDIGDMTAIEDAVNYFISYAIQHFGAEELIMIRNGYDQFKEHRAEHSWFINMVYDVKKMFLLKQFSISQLEELRDLLTNWTVNHIQVKDKHIGEHISL